jgi:hypothetical protein
MASLYADEQFALLVVELLRTFGHDIFRAKIDNIKQSKRNPNIENVSRITRINEASRRTHTG